MYPPELTAPMRQELVDMGVTELTDASSVDEALGKSGTTFLLINSVCGCAAGGARPGLAHALAKSEAKPDQVTTVFAGVDREATDRARSFLVGFPPSSPAMALLKDGEVQWMLHRHQIEGRYPEDIAAQIDAAFQAHCA
jgi:putative YphP/YqiW family bacilliredoxin